MRVLQDEQACDQPGRQRRLAGPRLADRGEALLQELPVDLSRQTDQGVIHVDDLIQRRPEQVLLPLVARLRHRFSPGKTAHSENHDPPPPGIPNRKKTSLEASFPANSITRQRKLVPQPQRYLNCSRATPETEQKFGAFSALPVR